MLKAKNSFYECIINTYKHNESCIIISIFNFFLFIFHDGSHLNIDTLI